MTEEKQKHKRSSFRDYLLGGAMGVLLVNSSYMINNGLIKPVSAYVQDVNSDGRMDFVVQQRNGKKQAFIQMQNGTYIPFEDYRNSKRKAIDDELARQSQEQKKRRQFENADYQKNSQQKYLTLDKEMNAIQKSLEAKTQGETK
jgi:hypothetical protein